MRDHPPRMTGRLRQGFAGLWGAVTGAAPHVLHHVGPLAGAAFLGGSGGRALFFLLGLAAATPLLWRLYRRFRSWAAPAVAVALFAGAYLVSSALVAPLFADDAPVATPAHSHDHEVAP